MASRVISCAGRLQGNDLHVRKRKVSMLIVQERKRHKLHTICDFIHIYLYLYLSSSSLSLPLSPSLSLSPPPSLFLSLYLSPSLLLSFSVSLFLSHSFS